MQGRQEKGKKEREKFTQDSHVLVEKPNFRMQCGIVGFFPLAPK
jgi:hypothetical protein